MSNMDNLQGFDRNLLIDIFVDVPVEHGQEFDDHRRWCGICLAPKTIVKQSASNEWAHRMCLTCTAVWPEYTTQYVDNDEDEIDEFDLSDIGENN